MHRQQDDQFVKDCVDTLYNNKTQHILRDLAEEQNAQMFNVTSSQLTDIALVRKMPNFPEAMQYSNAPDSKLFRIEMK